MLEHANFAALIPLAVPGSGSINHEQICMNCFDRFFTLVVKGPDNVYRNLDGHCRKCCVCCNPPTREAIEAVEGGL